MQAIEVRTVAGRIVRFGRDHETRLYYAACVCLLVAAAVLRFYDLSEKSLRHDEAVSANISRGALSEVVSGTRCCSSSPILYPLVLYAAQKIESTPFSLRIVPATASVLTIAVMLFLLPRLGVARGIAFLAALLATLSVEAIRHAQDAREYSVDALVALIMVAGLLRYLRDRKTALLCASLFVAPLVQYGLALFIVAVIGTAVVVPHISGQERLSANPSRVGDWLKRRLDLVAPCGFFLAGSAVSYWATLRFHGTGFASDGHLSPYYYKGTFDVSSIFEFSIDGIWSLLTYHLPEVVAVVALPALAILLVAALLGKFQGKFQDSAIVVLFSFCIVISVGVFLLGIYPLGGIRQIIYLGPIVFLAIGVAFHWAAGCLSLLTSRRWTMPTLLVITGGTALAGVSAMQQDSPYKTPQHIKSVLPVLKERVREDDIVYASWGAYPAIRFYQGKEEIPANYHHGKFWCTAYAKKCLHELIGLANSADWLGIVNSRIWFVTYMEPTVWEHELPGLSVEHVVSGGLPNLFLIEDTKSFIEIAAAAAATDILKNIQPILTRKPSIRSVFDVYLGEGTLIYVKEPCSAEDVQATFFLHAYPANASDLPERHKRHGFENLDFRFNATGVRSGKRCIVLRELPDYDFSGIHTGQYTDAGRLWEGEVRFAAAAATDILKNIQPILTRKPSIRSVFDVYLGEGTLIYVKEPCSAEDVQATFFLHAYPANASDLPERHKRHGFENLDFRFDATGVRSGKRCIVLRELPDYDFSGIHTGQYTDAGRLWEGEVRFNE